MKKEFLLGSAALAVVLVGIVLLAVLHPAPAKAPGTAPAASALPELSPYAEHGRYFDIAVNYPTTTPLSSEADASARAAMRAWAAGAVAQFKQDGNFAALTQNDIRTMGYDKGRKQTLQILYLEGSGAQTVSYIFTEYLDTLGAHPNTFFKTFTFDKTSGKLLSLPDIFSGGYLARLSTLSAAALAKNLGSLAAPDLIAAGTKPADASFQNWFFDNAEFVLLFSPYEVASYAAGPQTVRIPLASLASVLRSPYR